jgi:hypothetical protein
MTLHWTPELSQKLAAERQQRATLAKGRHERAQPGQRLDSYWHQDLLQVIVYQDDGTEP